MTGTTPSNVMDVIARRGDVLESVGTRGIGKRELVSQLSVSRSTIDRSVRELETIGLIERTGSGYRRTLAGQLALDEYETFEARIGGVVDCLDVLEPIEPSASLDAVILEDATIVRSDQYSPYRPVTELRELLDRATAVRSHVVSVAPGQIQTYADRTESGIDVELIIAERAAKRLISEFEAPFRRALETGRLDARQLSDSEEFGVLVANTSDGPEAGVLLLGESGVRAFARNDSSSAVAWAENLLDDLWERSDPLPVGDDI